MHLPKSIIFASCALFFALPHVASALSFTEGTVFVPLSIAENPDIIGGLGSNVCSNLSFNYSEDPANGWHDSESVSYTLDFGSNVSEGWFTGVSLLSDSAALADYSIEIFKNGSVDASWSTYPSELPLSLGTANIQHSMHSMVDWYGTTYTPTSEDFIISSGDSYEIKVTYHTDAGTVNTPWDVGNFMVHGSIDCNSLAVPEPSAALLGLLTASLVGLRRRR